MPAVIFATPPESPTTSPGTRRSSFVPSPSCPELFPPQQTALPPKRIAQVWNAPASMATTPLPSPTTSTGSRRFCLVLSPSWPYAFDPQHLTPPDAVIAHAWAVPTLNAIGALKPGTGIGVELEAVDPLPSWPDSFQPQHDTPGPRPDASAQEKALPVPIAVALEIPATATGELKFAVALLPSWP